MKGCFHIDALVDLSVVLGPDVSERLAHLEQCGSCRSELATMVAVREALGDQADGVGERTLAATRAAIRREARSARAERARPRRWGSAAEIVLAGLTSLALAFSTGVVGQNLAPVILMSAACAAVVGISGRTRSENGIPHR